jgi:hypothetical protein
LFEIQEREARRLAALERAVTRYFPLFEIL